MPIDLTGSLGHLRLHWAMLFNRTVPLRSRCCQPPLQRFGARWPPPAHARPRSAANPNSQGVDGQTMKSREPRAVEEGESEAKPMARKDPPARDEPCTHNCAFQVGAKRRPRHAGLAARKQR